VIELSPEQIAAACGATIEVGERGSAGAVDFPRRAASDSRSVGPGDLFFGLSGESGDGGAFASEAIEAGAWGVVLTPGYARQLAGTTTSARVLSAEDPMAALHGLTRAWLGRLREDGCRVVGITGSTGKTSTKDILLALIRESFDDHAHANRENYNTEIGLPLSVLEAAPDTRCLVLEMAMRGIGQIRELAQIAQPEIGVITNVGPVHLELVGTIERVAKAKAELIAELPADGICVVPAEEEVLRPHLRSDIRAITFGGETADVRILDSEVVEGATEAQIAVGPEQVALRFNFTQAHNLTNALAAIGAAQALGISLEALKGGAGNVVFSSLRGEEIELPDGGIIINDCYNANPTSMRAALDHLVLTASRRSAPRSVAILGEMKELGPQADSYHREVGEHARRGGVDVLLAVGNRGQAYADGFADAGEFQIAQDAEQAAELAGRIIAPGDTVLIKASRSVGLERVAQALVAG